MYFFQVEGSGRQPQLPQDWLAVSLSTSTATGIDIGIDTAGGILPEEET